MPETVPVTVVVNGQPTQVQAGPEAAVQSLIERALQQTGNAGQPPDNWELRNSQGQAIPLATKVADILGQTLFLNLKAGVGG
jgi:Protein of Unknown function (DUF2604)